MDIYALRMKEWIDKNGVEADFMSFSKSVHSVKEAVEATGYPQERFTKSIVILTSSNDVVVAVVPGDSRASTERVRKALNLAERPRTATASEIERHLAQLMGGNSPLNAPNARILIDPKVLEKDWIITGGGNNRSLVRISIEELRRVVDFVEVRVRK